MKTFTKLFLAFAMLIIAGNASAAVKEYELDQKLTSIASLDGKMFAIVDESVSKAFYGSTNQNVAFGAYADAFLETNAAIQFRLVAATGEGVDGCYYLQSVKADGSDYSIWGGGYLNTTPAEGGNNCVFIMGLNGQNGQDILNGAVWTIEENDGKFSILSKGTGKYLKDNSQAKYDDPTYFSFYTLKEKKSEDPLAPEKADLSDAIDLGKLQTDFAKTTASWNTLQDAITAGEAELVKASATAESLVAATKAITDAIDGLELQEGYTNLTKDMMFTWTGWGKEAVKGSVFNDCAYVLFKSTGQPYGDPSVNAWADLSGYEKLVVVATGTPRFLLNRDADNGQWNADESQSHLIDNTVGDGESWHAQYFSQEGNLYTVDLAKLTKNKGFAYLNAIKARSNITVSGMYLYRAPDPLQPEKDALQAAIDLGNLQNSFAKTTASWNTLQDAIGAGEYQLLNASTTAELLVAATKAITDAVAGLELQDGYTNLTQNMYYAWDSATSPSEGSYKGGCDYYINVSTGMPYGNGNVPLLSFADLSEFDEFDILATGGTPRILLNRDIENGQCSDVEENSHLIDNTNAGCMTWASKYFSTSGSNVTVDLKLMATNKGFAHLHTIKTVGGNVTVSDMVLYRTITVGETGYATFGSLYKNAKFNDGVTAYAVTYTGGKTVSLAPVTTVSAGKGVIIEAEAGEYAPTFDVEADETASDLLVSNGTVVGDGSTIYVLNKVNDKLGFYLLKAGEKLEAGKAYLVVPANNEARGFIGFDGATGINEVNVNKAAVKTGKIYNLNGQIVSKPSKGLFIVDGKVVSF